jgi:TolB-like protein
VSAALFLWHCIVLPDHPGNPIISGFVDEMKNTDPKYSFQSELTNIELDLNRFTIKLYFQNLSDPTTIHFDKPARKFYFSLIALVVNAMKAREEPEFVSVRRFEKTLRTLDLALAGKHASQTVETMWDKIRKAWRYSLPDLEAGSLFKVFDRRTISPFEKGGKQRYDCSENECDTWANLFLYDENNPWRFKFAVDSCSLGLEEVSLKYGELRDDAAWQEFMQFVTAQVPGYLQESTAQSATARKRQLPPFWKKVVFPLAVVPILLIALVALRYFSKQSNIHPSGEEFAKEISIAVLPFDNMSGDQTQDFFCDGFTDDLITDLSKVPDLLVIARNSSFTFKGKTVKIQQIAKELEVKYILEGSIRKIDKRVRVNAQLVDGVDGHHLWAGKYDREIGDIFTMQELISKKILTALNVKLTLGEQARLFSNNTDNLEAYLTFLKAVHHMRRTNREGTLLAREICEKAIALDPDYSDPYRVIGWSHLWDIWFDWTDSPENSFKKAEEYVNKSLDLDADNPGSVALVGHLYLLKRQHEKAIAWGERSIALDPNSANNYMILAGTLRFSGRAAEGIPLLLKAIRLEPHTPANFYYQLGMAYNFTGQYNKAISALKNALNQTPDHLLSLIGLTIAYSLADQMDEARATASKLLREDPNLSVENLEKRAPYKNRADLELSTNALRKAGLD